MARGVDSDVGGGDAVNGSRVWGKGAVEEREETTVEGAVKVAREVDDKVEERG